MKRIGIYPGTFDPITFGHIDIIKRAMSIVDLLIVAVASDVNKKPLFPLETRAEMVDQEIQNMKSRRITVKSFSGLLINFAIDNQATLIIRGLRAVSDFEYEFKMNWINHKLSDQVETIFLPASEDTQFISSNFVKEVARLRGDIKQFVPEHVAYQLDNSTR